tara:strand:+ start:1787 stop:1945 length:159 start_codon:yes stop_codon:yes gene_type:complete
MLEMVAVENLKHYLNTISHLLLENLEAQRRQDSDLVFFLYKLFILGHREELT